MQLTHHMTLNGPRWALDGHFLPKNMRLGTLLSLPRPAMLHNLHESLTAEPAGGDLLPPLDADHEVWASGVTYLRSRDARQTESSVADVYTRVYEAERPELFLKAIGWRVVGPGGVVRFRHDSTWDVPEPEIVLLLNRHMEVVGYTAGNDMSSRSIEGENPLYLPQAKIYDGSCALGPAIQLATVEELRNLAVSVEIERGGAAVFSGHTSAHQMKRRFEELAAYLGRALSFPYGALLMTGTGIVPPESFTLQSGDVVHVQVGELRLTNGVERTEEK
ncbi:MAG: fumarylacetoacetate hydrolase family protein [Chloroflexaceae bacterium]|jgi:2-dehydro-3-deoxy-D-arabinonate dehydratase|nr:fumarylacetoacetate hydrolase family protein [Chloroflexaceae bacterium]